MSRNGRCDDARLKFFETWSLRDPQKAGFKYLKNMRLTKAVNLSFQKVGLENFVAKRFDVQKRVWDIVSWLMQVRAKSVTAAVPIGSKGSVVLRPSLSGTNSWRRKIQEDGSSRG
jgi:hypothetical protein